MATVLFITLLSGCADAAAVGQRKSEGRYHTKTVHHVSNKYFYDDKKYGDGSLKKFFVMLKVILTVFGKG